MQKYAAIFTAFFMQQSFYFFFILYQKEKMLRRASLKTAKQSLKDDGRKRDIALKEFNDELLNLVTMQNKTEKIYSMNKQLK